MSKRKRDICVGTVSMEVKHDKQRNLKKYETFIKRAANLEIDLLVFPECSYQGFIWSIGSKTRSVTMEGDQLTYFYEASETIPGELTSTIKDLAASYNMHIIVGLVEKTSYGDGAALYNSTALIGPKGVIGVFRKVHNCGEEFHLFVGGPGFPVFETEIAKIGMLICYDNCFPESARLLAIRGANIICMPTAWPAHSASEDGEIKENDTGLDYYRLFTRSRAVENQVWFVSSNWVGLQEKGFGGPTYYPGHSMIISPGGKVIANTDQKEDLAHARIQIESGMLKARTQSFFGHNFLRDRKPSAYGDISSPK